MQFERTPGECSRDDQPFVIPMVYGRDGDRLLLHGSVVARVMRSPDAG